MSSFVLDCSVAMCWCFADEATPLANELLQHLDEAGAVVPSLWHLEVANVLSLALRKGRIVERGVSSFLNLISGLPLNTDNQTVAHALTDTLMLSRTLGITAYDAAYLELAQRLDIPLASKDVQLCRAARRIKVPLIGD